MSNANEAGANSDLHDLEPLQELEPMPAEPANAAAPSAARAPSAAPQEIEKAPLMLQKAALFLVVATLLPWLVPEGFNLARLGAKAVILLGGWVAYCGVEFAHGGKTPLDGLGKAHKLALPLASYVVILAGIGLTLIAPAWQGMIEASGLAVGVLAWCGVHGYARGGKFNPMMALVIPMFGLAAFVNVIVVAVKDFEALPKLLAIVGSLGVTGAGGFAGYTMFLAMKEAKAHGEAKKRAQAEARAEERRRKRGDPGAAGSAQG
ncbi:MAG: hypothetical protein IT454_21185 [Planctomycetes bacterium]|nr:hypothetical protein [Planctomycetota bacterium]